MSLLDSFFGKKQKPKPKRKKPVETKEANRRRMVAKSPIRRASTPDKSKVTRKT